MTAKKKLRSCQTFLDDYDYRLLSNYCIENDTTIYRLFKTFACRIAEAQDNIERSRRNEQTIPENAYRLVYESEHLDNLK